MALLGSARAFSGLCGGQWLLDLATFPSPAEYKELRERESGAREPGGARQRREMREAAHLKPDPETVHTTLSPLDALFDNTMSLLRKSQLLIIKKLWLLHMLKNISFGLFEDFIITACIL